MLGWEFPPAISGGLGIAFLSICRALAPKVDLTVIVPKHDKGIRIKGAGLIGIGNLDIESFFEEKEIKGLEKVIKNKQIRIELSPYPKYTSLQGVRKETRVGVKQKPPGNVQQLHQRFRDSDLYGQNVVEMIRYYAEVIDIIASKISFDIIHAHDWMTFEAGIRLKKKYNKPLILHIHSLNFDRIGPDKEGLFYQIEKNAFKVADRILPVSYYTGSIISEHYGVNPAKIVPVHNGIDPVKPFKTKKRFPEKLILFMGRITLQKGPEYFLETASKVIEKYPNVRFAIAGTGDQLNKIIEEGAYKEISHKIHFTGFLDRPKVHSLLSMADIFCMPSVSEPFGLTALEAVQFEIPVIITKRSGAAEVLPSAFRADFWDTDLMSKQIIDLLKDKTLYTRKVSEGKSDIKNLSWATTADKIVAEYRKIIP